jgi:hypothetical protein
MAQGLEGFGTVTFTSLPDSAEIYVDEKFVGNTPATLKLPAGTHIVILKAAGYVYWARRLEVLKSSRVSVKATLDPSF